MSCWPAVDRLIDRSGSLDALRFHKLSLLAAQRFLALLCLRKCRLVPAMRLIDLPAQVFCVLLFFAQERS